jgi:hypothetical protein
MGVLALSSGVGSGFEFVNRGVQRARSRQLVRPNQPETELEILQGGHLLGEKMVQGPGVEGQAALLFRNSLENISRRGSDEGSDRVQLHVCHTCSHGETCARHPFLLTNPRHFTGRQEEGRGCQERAEAGRARVGPQLSFLGARCDADSFTINMQPESDRMTLPESESTQVRAKRVLLCAFASAIREVLSSPRPRGVVVIRGAQRCPCELGSPMPPR